MKRRICARRFTSSVRRNRGLADARRYAEEIGQSDLEPHPVGIPSFSSPDPSRKVRSRVQLAAAVVTGLFLMVLTVALGTPLDRSPRRYAGDRFVTPLLEHLIWWDSFSEIEQTKGILRGLSLQAIAQIQRAYLLSRSEQVPGRDTVNAAPLQDPLLSNAIDHVRKRLEEFQGTEYVTIFQAEMLRLLRKTGRHPEWLNLYLELIYTQPGNALIFMESTRALDAAKSTGRETELHDALDHWNQIPEKYRSDTTGSVPPQR